MKKLSALHAADVASDIGAEQVVMFAFKGDIAQCVAWGYTEHQLKQARQWADKRFHEIMAGAIRPPSEEPVRKRCKHTPDMFA